MSTPLLEAVNLSVVRQQRHILHEVSLRVGQHDFITIIGPNGAGKSMLLKCLMGFFPPDGGNITRKAGLRIGYVPQRLAIEPSIPLTVDRFLTLRRRTTEAELKRVAEETGAAPLLKQFLPALSGGELQRVLLARALLGNPEILILDEPAQNLDISSQLAFYKLLDRIYAERNIAILMVSHDLHLVMASTRQVVCLFHHVCCSGTPQAVTKDPEFIALFGEDMARRMAVYHHEHGHDHDHTHDHGHHHA